MTAPVILGFDTSGPYCGAALRWGPDRVATRFEEMAKGQAECLMALLEALLEEQGASWSDIDELAVGVGPGNFTGIRIAVSAARGLALGLGIPARGVSSFEASYAATPLDRNRDSALVTVAAPRGSYYAQWLSPVGHQDSPRIVAMADPAPQVPAGAEPHFIGPSGAWEAKDWSRGGVHSFGQGYVVQPNDMAPAIAKAASQTHWDGTRPAPMYVKPPDAAPPRDQAPLIVP